MKLDQITVGSGVVRMLGVKKGVWFKKNLTIFKEFHKTLKVLTELAVSWRDLDPETYRTLCLIVNDTFQRK